MVAIAGFPLSVRSIFSDTSVDFSFPDNKTVFSPAQKSCLENVLHIHPQRIAQVRQVHGDTIHIIEKPLDPAGPLKEGDGLIIDKPGVALAIRTADCLPVFIHDPKKKVIALIHAGWKGSQCKIVTKSINLLKEKWRSRPEDILTGFGPAIRACCYEVGDEFRKHFPDSLQMRGGKIFMDLALENKRQLLNSGVLDKNIHDMNVCTCCSKNFYSYRRDGAKCGRHLSLMMMCSVD